MKMSMKGRMSLKELEKFRDYNELDVVYKMQEMLKLSEKNAEKVVKGNRTAEVSLRKSMNDIRIMCLIMRDMVKMRSVPAENNGALEAAIQQEKETIEREKKRYKLAPDHVVEEQLRKIRLSEKLRRENREQKIKDGKGATGGEPQETEGEL